MKANRGKHFLFITPFLTEVERIKTECAELDFIEPSDEDGTKTNSLKKSLIDKRNIVSTHSLFSLIDEALYALLKTGEYTLILDEVMDSMHQENVTQHDLSILKEKYFLINEASCQISLTEEGQDYKGKLQDYTNYARQGRLYCFGGTVLIWQLPPEVFIAMKEVYLLTYLFRAQIMRCYCDFHTITYDMNDVRGSRAKGYSLAPHDPIKSDENFRIRLKNLLNIYLGNLNSVVRKEPTFSWYINKKKKELRSLRNALYNYFTNIVKGNAYTNMWTTFKDKEEYLKGNSYTDGFIAHNTRATNQYAHKKNLAYLIDRRLNPGLVQYLQTRAVVIDEGLFAISELIRWVFRSAIRNGESVNLFLPSDRMRGLLYGWMDSGCAIKKVI